MYVIDSQVDYICIFIGKQQLCVNHAIFFSALDLNAGSSTKREKYEPDQLVMFSDVKVKALYFCEWDKRCYSVDSSFGSLQPTSNVVLVKKLF